MGSPPLARDKFVHFLIRGKFVGITPACAGQIICVYITVSVHRDHPRLRGTNSFGGYQAIRKKGSPPLARDKWNRSTSNPDRTRITPACAGQMQMQQLRKSTSQDHPRLRGTNLLVRLHLKAILGSPPLARDKLHHYLALHTHRRITPACAGQIFKCFC